MGRKKATRIKKTCAYCNAIYIGVKQSLYCRRSCSSLAWRSKVSTTERQQLEVILKQELEGIAGKDIKMVVDVCLYSVAKWKKGKL